MDGAAAHKVISDWPGKIMFTGLGKDVMTGGRLVAQGPKDNPVPPLCRFSRMCLIRHCES
jgi:hypothetical protein